MRRRVRVATLALLLPASGCCTSLLWDAAPRVHAERLLGARVDDEGRLEVGVELNDGRRLAYRESQGDHFLGPFLWMEKAPGVDAGSIAWACTPGDGGLTLHPVPSTVAGAIDARLEFWPDGIRMVSVDAQGSEHGKRIELPESGDLRWERPFTWLCVVATPVTVAVDVVTLPVQAVWLVLYMPRC